MPSPSASPFGATAAAPVGNPLKSAAQDVRSKQRKASWVIDASRRPQAPSGQRLPLLSEIRSRAPRRTCGQSSERHLGLSMPSPSASPFGTTAAAPVGNPLKSAALPVRRKTASTDTGYACALRNFVSLRPRSANPASAPRPPTMRTSSARGGRRSRLATLAPPAVKGCLLLSQQGGLAGRRFGPHAQAGRQDGGTRPARPPRPLLLVLARHHGFGGRGRGGNGRGRGNRGRFVASASAHKNLPLSPLAERRARGAHALAGRAPQGHRRVKGQGQGVGRIRRAPQTGLNLVLAFQLQASGRVELVAGRPTNPPSGPCRREGRPRRQPLAHGPPHFGPAVDEAGVVQRPRAEGRFNHVTAQATQAVDDAPPRRPRR